LARALQALSDPYYQSTCLSVCPHLWSQISEIKRDSCPTGSL